MGGAGVGGGDGEWTVGETRLSVVQSMTEEGWEALVLVCSPDVAPPKELAAAVEAQFRLDKASQEAGAVSVVQCEAAAGGRLVLAATGTLGPYDDVRSVYEAARAGAARAGAAGAARVVLALQPHPRFPRAELVALLGALEAFYAPLQVRESWPERAPPLRALGALSVGARAALPALLRDAAALEAARVLARDLGGADPERMTPGAFAAHVQAHFADSPVRVRVVDDRAAIARDYPLFAAVSRAADAVPRHTGRIVFLEYAPEHYDSSVYLVGKGVTYDTGGCDVKAGGAMAGMSRDKCGAAAAAGFVALCARLRPALRVTAALALVRNSIGEEAYVADELLRSRGGLAVRVGNTDAEGRMAMADLLHEMAARARGDPCAHLYTLATLTGHVHRAYGTGYTAALDNHTARERGHAARLLAAAETLGDMVEVSTLRREDFATHRGRAAGDQLHQADSRPSTAMPRGHQGPAAFLALAAALDADGAPAYTHLDVAASAGELPDPPTAAPLLALAAHLGLVTSC